MATYMVHTKRPGFRGVFSSVKVEADSPEDALAQVPGSFRALPIPHK